MAKIYLRRGVADQELIARIGEVFPSSILLEADICRRELLLEIEGVAILGKTPRAATLREIAEENGTTAAEQ